MGQFEEMQNFIRVVEAGSISKAAEQLGVAKSGVSRRLVELESRLSLRLLNRTTRRSSLTEAGQAFYTGAKKLLGDVSELNAVTTDTDALLEGTLRLAIPLSFGLCHLSPAINEFLGAHPKLTINIDFSDRRIDLVSIMPGYGPQQLSAYAVYPQTRYLSRRARLFIDFLVERFGENPYWDQFS